MKTSENQSLLETLLGRLLAAPKGKQSQAIEAALSKLAGEGSPVPDQILLNATGAARVMAVSKMTIWRLVKAGTIKPVILPGTKFRKYRKADLERLAAGGTT